MYHENLSQDQMLYVWWDQQSIVYYQLLKFGETIDSHRYHRQLIKLHLIKYFCLKKNQIINKNMEN